MKRSFISFLLFFILCNMALAQPQFGVIGGVNLSGLTTKLDNYSKRTGMHVGILADIPFGTRSPFSLRSGLVYNNKGVKFGSSTQDSLGNIYASAGTQYVNYIDMPAHLIYTSRPLGKIQFFFGAGPYLSFFYSGKETSTFISPDISYSTEVSDLPNGKAPGDYATINYGVSGLAGIQVGSVFLNGTYSYGLNDFYRSKDMPGKPSFRHAVIGVGLGVFLNKRERPESKEKEKDVIAIATEKPILKKDTDGDGVNDDEDACPTIKGTLKYKGCAIPDTDMDGIDDEHDECKTVPGPLKYKGCPAPDLDNDGVADEEDKCPDVPGKKEYNGCPMPVDASLEPVSVTADQMCYTINFDYNRAELQVDAFVKLRGLVSILKQNDALQIDIKGHSDNIGTPTSKDRISAERAEVVQIYLLSYSINKARIRSSYHADREPLDKEQQWMNRRVDICISYKK